MFGLDRKRIILGTVAIIGFAIMAYLTYIHYANTRSFCDLSESVSCDIVTTSIYSEIFGIPMSILGLLYFAAVFFLSVFRKKHNSYLFIFLATVFSIIPSLYLSFIELFVIKSICVLCETSKILMFSILAVSYLEIREKINFRIIAPVLISGIVAVGVTYFAQTGTSPKADYSNFVETLNKKGVVYYKSVKCSNCKRQEKMFGSAIKKLNSVECHPEGFDPQPELCLKKRITKTPTFLIEKDNVEVKRIEGLQQLDNLAKWAEVPFQEK